MDWIRKVKPVTSSFMLTLPLSLKCQPINTLNQSQDLVVSTSMIALLIAPMFAAAGYSLIYLLLGGGLGGAFLIFIVAKMMGK